VSDAVFLNLFWAESNFGSCRQFEILLFDTYGDKT